MTAGINARTHLSEVLAGWIDGFGQRWLYYIEAFSLFLGVSWKNYRQ